MSAPSTPLVGQRIKRREDPRLIQGRGTYVDDIKLAGMLHLAFKRSDIAHGTIKKIDFSAALKLEGVEAVFIGDDLKALLPPMPVLTPFPNPPHYSVAVEKVRYVGEPVAVVVASDRYIARDALDLIEVEIDPLPVVTNPEEAMKPGAPQLHEGFANNIAIFVPAGTGVDQKANTVDNSAIDKAFSDADIVVSQRMYNQRLIPAAVETRGVVAQYEPGKDLLTIWSSSQNPHILRTQVAAMMKMGENEVRAVAPEVGGGFGSKINVYGEDYAACAISKKLGVPVKWIEDRTEAFLATIHGRDILGYLEVAAKRDGKVLGLRAKLVADIGAYEMMFTVLVPTLTNGMLSGVYDIPAIRCELHEVFTNKTPVDAYRGAGRPEGIYFVERSMDMLARELNMDPAELRRRNFIKPEQFPFNTQAGNRYDSGNYAPCLEKALQIADWDGLQKQRDEARKQGRVMGLGLSFYVEICGIGGWEHSTVTVERDGRITGTTGVSPHGQGNETTFSQLLADLFAVPMDNIQILHGDTSTVKAGLGTYGSRSQVVGGTTIVMAGEKVKATMAMLAGHMLGCDASEIVFEDGTIYPLGAPNSGKSFAEVAAYAYLGAGMAAGSGKPYPAGFSGGLSGEAMWEPAGATFPFGCHISLIEIDRETGVPKLLKFVAVDDCGTIVNPLLVEGQVHGGLAQGIGQAMIEEALFDDEGNLITGSLMDYAVPRATDFPRFELDHTVTKSPLTPLGTKGVGEAGTIGSTPCIVNAVVDALSPFGVKHIDMMLRPEKLWRAIRQENRLQ